MSNTHPQVAVVTTRPIGKDTAAGLAVRSLFLDWDRDRLTQIYSPFVRSGKPDFDVCHDYRRLHWNGTVARVTPVEANDVSASPGGTRRLAARLAANRHVQRLGTPFRDWWLGRERYLEGIQAELASIRPDVVYSLLGNTNLAKATSLACERLDLPLFIHVVDDYVRAFQKPGVPLPLSPKPPERWLQRASDHATGHAAIGPHMAEEYERRYGGGWTWFTTLTNAEDYMPAPRATEPGEPLKLVFAGNLGYNRWRTLQKLGLVLASLQRRGVSAELVIFAPPADVEQYKKVLDIPRVVEVRNWVPMERLPEVFHDADILVHVESCHDQEYMHTIKWSFSTKISQYMMAGRCLLAIGPPSLASMKFIREHEVGITVEMESETNLEEKLRLAFMERERIIRIGRIARDKAMEFFDGTSQRKRFLDALLTTILKHRERQARGLTTPSTKKPAGLFRRVC